MRWLLPIALLAACSASEPGVDFDEDDPGQLDPNADTVVSFTEQGTLRTCAETVPVCDGSAPLEPCGQDAVLGPADGVFGALEAGGQLEVAFRCGSVLETGGVDSPDFSIAATVPAGSSALVQVSVEGVDYVDLAGLDSTVQQFDIGREQIDQIRFVRVIDSGAGGIEIDAFEALPAAAP